MIDPRYSITADATAEVESLLARFERDRDRGRVDLTDYLLFEQNPAFSAVATELSRIDLEHAFNEGTEPNASRYIAMFPDVFADDHHRTQLAFEEYRLRRRAGEDITGHDIGTKYSIDGSHWPHLKLGSDTPRASCRFTESDLIRPSVHYPLAGETFAGHPLLARIGEGAFSRVFLAQQPDLAGRLVVLKLTPLSTEESDRLASLQHTSIIPVYSIYREGELSCICMPFIGATTLADLSACGARWASLDGPAEELVSTIMDRRLSTMRVVESRRKPGQTESHDDVATKASPVKLPSVTHESQTELEHYSRLGYVDALIALVSGAVEGLDHAHRRGVIHRDLKPANILIADDGNAVLLDFNLAVSSLEPKTRVVGGTLPYMSPQQLASLQTGADADKRDDIFSMGVILYELLSGKLPFKCPGAGDAFDLDDVISDRSVKPDSIRDLNPRVSPGLASVIEHCTAPQRDQRYQDASQLLDDLNRHRTNLPLKFASDRSVAERLHKWTKRHPRLSSATSVGAFATALLLMSLALIWQRGEQIKRLDVQSKYQAFQHELPLAVASLSTPGREPELLSGGLDQASRLMQQWSPRSPQGEFETASARLNLASQRDLKNELAYLAFLMSNAELDLGLQGDESAKVQHSEHALLWSELASVLSPDLASLTGFQQSDISIKLDGARVDSVGPLAKMPSDSDLHLRALWAAEQHDVALFRELTRKQLDDHPTSATYWFNLAAADWQMGDFDNAAAYFDVSSRLQPRSLSSLLNRGICNLQRGEAKLAHADFTACLVLNENALVPRFNRALASHELGDHQSALNDLDYVIQNGLATVRAHLMRARVHDVRGNADQAKADRRAAMRIAPRDANDWISRGLAQLSHSPEAALANFETALQILPNDIHAIKNAAHVYAERLDNAERAIVLLTRLIAVRPHGAAAVASRGILYARKGELEKATADAQDAERLSPGAREQLQIAGIYAMVSASPGWEKRLDDGFVWLSRALQTDIRLARTARDDRDLANLKADPRFARLIDNAIAINAQSDALDRKPKETH